MKQLEFINALKATLPSIIGLKGAILIGSFARKSNKWSSDIDLCFWVGHEFDANEFIKMMSEIFPDDFVFGIDVRLRNHITIYFKDCPKMDIGIYDSINGWDRNFLGSEILNVKECVLFDPNGEVLNHLQEISSRQKEMKSDTQPLVEEYLNKFLYEFEQFSESHRRSDSYRSYYFYGIALHSLIQIKYLITGNRSFLFLPKNFVATQLSKEEEQLFRAISGTLYLPEVNQLKRRLLDFFYAVITGTDLVTTARRAEIQAFCEMIYKRDFVWNFRDLSSINPRFLQKRIFRSSSLTRYQDEPFFEELLRSCKIKAIIDLRDHEELARSSYHLLDKYNVRHVHVPIDPRNQSDKFREQHLIGTNIEIAYRYFAVACKMQVFTIFEEILKLDDGAILIHCHAGKDRTGFIISLLHLLLETPITTVMEDYLSSEMDTQAHFLDTAIALVDQEGGIHAYLRSCGLTEEQLQLAKLKLQTA